MWHYFGHIGKSKFGGHCFLQCSQKFYLKMGQKLRSLSCYLGLAIEIEKFGNFRQVVGQGHALPSKRNLKGLLLRVLIVLLLGLIVAL